MDLVIERKYRKIGKNFFNKYTLYGFLAVVVIANLFLFPNLLNHKDMKFNDMSYLLNTESSIPVASKGDKVTVNNLVNATIDSEKEALPVANNTTATPEIVPSAEEIKNTVTVASPVPVVESNENTKSAPEFIPVPDSEKEKIVTPTEEKPKSRNSSYLMILGILLLAVSISFAIFIHKNLATIKVIFLKSSNARDMYNGYVLLHD
jgi:hypothetical protein